MFCEKCGAEIDDDSNFCIKCGNKITVEFLTENKLNDEFIIKTLSNYCTNEDSYMYYVYAYSTPSLASSALVGVFSLLNMKNCLVGVTNARLILVSIDVKINEKEHWVIPLNQIKSIKISNGLLTKKIKIILPDNSNVMLHVNPVAIGIKRQKENLDKIYDIFH